MALYLIFLLLMKHSLFVVGEEQTKSNITCIDDVTATIFLSFGFYKSTCPEAEPIIYSLLQNAVSQDPRLAASLLRLHFHDCFVNGCDASVLLDDTPNFSGEKSAAPNLNSLRGFEVIDDIKATLEFVCPETVSCADILTIAARDSVVLSGGPGWEVQMGRKDSLTASKIAANNNIPGPNSDLATLVNKFQNLGLTLIDMVTLSGAHTMGKARCSSFSGRLSSNANSPDINLEFIQSLEQLCFSSFDVNTTLADLDLTTPSTFDNQYYVNLLSGEGLLQSDQVLINSGDDQTRELVQSYVDDPTTFFEQFKNSMIKLGSITGENGEIRKNCRFVN